MAKFRLRKPSAMVRGMLRTNKHQNWLKTRIRMQHNQCWYCHTKMDDDATLDHYIPLSKGGADEFDNTRAAHHECNQRKGNMMPDDFVKQLRGAPE